jgi:DNA gyrase/topoisomerase IV subunit A
LNSNDIGFWSILNSVTFPAIVFINIKNKRLGKLNVQKLKETLKYLESKQRELKKQNQSDTRSLESMIKYLKKDMMEQHDLSEHHQLIKQEIKDTETFIENVKNIIKINS